MFSTTVDDRERERRKGQELDGDPEPESMRPFIARSFGPLWLSRLCETGVRAVNPREGKAATFPRHMSIRGTELSRRRSLLLTGRVPITPDAPTRCLDCKVSFSAFASARMWHEWGEGKCFNQFRPLSPLAKGFTSSRRVSCRFHTGLNARSLDPGGHRGKKMISLRARRVGRYLIGEGLMGECEWQWTLKAAACQRFRLCAV